MRHSLRVMLASLDSKKQALCLAMRLPCQLLFKRANTMKNFIAPWETRLQQTDRRIYFRNILNSPSRAKAWVGTRSSLSR